MAEETYEGLMRRLYPMGLEEALQASQEFADQEMLADIYRRVDPSVNPGGEYGLFPAIGQSRDGGARYKGVEVGVGDSYVSGELGSYLPEHNPVDEEGYVYSKRQGYPLSSQLLMEKGMDPLKPGEIYFQQFSGDVQPFKNTTRKEIEDPASTLIHEFFHRAVDAPWFDEFADWAKNEASGSWTMPSTRDAAAFIRSLVSSVEKEQSFAHTLDDTARGEAETNQYSTDVANQKKLVSMDKALRAFFTPERQEKYGLRLPLKATVPEEENTGLFDIFTTLPAMLLEKVPEALGFDKTGEGPVEVPEEFYGAALPMANGGIVHTNPKAQAYAQGALETIPTAVNYVRESVPNSGPFGLSTASDVIQGLISMGFDAQSLLGGMGQAAAEAPVETALDMTPGIAEGRAMMDADSLISQALVAEEAGDLERASMLRQLAMTSLLGMVPGIPNVGKLARKAKTPDALDQKMKDLEQKIKNKPSNAPVRRDVGEGTREYGYDSPQDRALREKTRNNK